MPFHPPPVSPSLLKATLSTLSQSAILTHWLHPNPSPYLPPSHSTTLRSALLIALDTEWYEHSPSHITELGISLLDPQFLPSRRSNPWALLSTLVTQHVRVAPNAHLVNGDLCPGYPEAFQFGTTAFVSVEQARDMLRYSFTRMDRHGGKRPVVFIGHAVDSDVEVVRERFGLDIEALGVVVTTLDTQVLAREMGVAMPGRKIKLRDLLGRFGVEETFLHNAGNDVVGTMVAAMLMGCGGGEMKTNAQAYQGLKKRLRERSKVLYGSVLFCTVCDSDKHVAEYCRAVVHCEHCATTHKTEKCPEMLKATAKQMADAKEGRMNGPPYACPCHYCIESVDPKRYAHAYAYGHQAEKCIHGFDRSTRASPSS